MTLYTDDELDLDPDYRHCCWCDDVEHELDEPDHERWYCSKRCYVASHG